MRILCTITTTLLATAHAAPPQAYSIESTRTCLKSFAYGGLDG